MGGIDSMATFPENWADAFAIRDVLPNFYMQIPA